MSELMSSILLENFFEILESGLCCSQWLPKAGPVASNSLGQLSKNSDPSSQAQKF